MSARSFIAILLLINYLLVVGTGCVNRPEDSRELLLVQTTEDGQSYQQCRYLRMDGLETFLAEALATRYQDTAKKAPHHLFVVVYGVDAHHLPGITWPSVAPVFRSKSPAVGYKPAASIRVDRDLYTPPWLG